ncbi:hypothetical protein LEP1GSC036_3276 [Leptospira weilii str. 2006001853]|uniref:Uncharacterized protein n=2 Tax=Leptospira weilii TaxID=28184 RepID=A0A828Z376_9LEPT|nr:hypothetical protein LEP1GSC036_3276 [Leptospira weilii str. 2006001853]EMM73780.1 hypothetical protein LEP1GSC038_3465 [Leptospira weilii str. 2006001855]
MRDTISCSSSSKRFCIFSISKINPASPRYTTRNRRFFETHSEKKAK